MNPHSTPPPPPPPGGPLVLGVPRPALVIFGVEFAERLGYYAVAFSLFTYGRHMLGVGTTGMHAVTSSIYIVIPMAACLSSGLADGVWGRNKTLMVFLVAYACGLGLLTISSMPWMYEKFPLDPTVLNYILFATSLCCFAVGYGGMKVCTNPMMADSITVAYRAMFAEEDAARVAGLDCGAAADRETTVHDLVVAADGDDGFAAVEKDNPATAPAPGTPFDSDGAAAAAAAALEEQQQTLERVLTRAFNLVYWVSNLGSLLGIFATPLMRGLDGRQVSFGDESYPSGYYFGFAMATVSVLVGLLFFYYFRGHFPRNAPTPPFLFFRYVIRATVNRLLFACGRIEDHGFQGQVERDGGGLLLYGTYNATTASGSGSGGDAFTDGARRNESDDLSARVWLEDCRATLRVCKAFVALPIYWLISNQFSSSLMFSIEALSLPPSIPPEVFNNINTFTLLAFIALCDGVVYPRYFSGGRRGPPSARARITVGFLLLVASMLWCGVVQSFIRDRGTYVGAQGEYQVNEGHTKLSAGLLVVPYILQGVAAALVDPASMEVAYTGAPAHMKGTVMALYWIASSASGFLGLVLSPVMKPDSGVALYLSFAAALLVVTGIFWRLNHSGAYTNVAIESLVKARS